jgi:hypothetical protein
MERIVPQEQSPLVNHPKTHRIVANDLTMRLQDFSDLLKDEPRNVLQSAEEWF